MTELLRTLWSESNHQVGLSNRLGAASERETLSLLSRFPLMLLTLCVCLLLHKTFPCHNHNSLIPSFIFSSSSKTLPLHHMLNYASNGTTWLPDPMASWFSLPASPTRSRCETLCERSDLNVWDDERWGGVDHVWEGVGLERVKILIFFKCLFKWIVYSNLIDRC